LRDAVALSDWEGERRARRLLADILQVSDEPELAAQHLVRAGEVSAVKQPGADQTSRHLDITNFLHATPYWTACRLTSSAEEAASTGSLGFLIRHSLV
jgi:hypothetical protein